MAMFAALAFGAPIGTQLYSFSGFVAVAGATTLVPLITLVLVAPLKPVPGVGSAFSIIGFGAMIGFSSLLSAARGWSPLWLAFSALAISLVDHFTCAREKW